MYWEECEHSRNVYRINKGHTCSHPLVALHSAVKSSCSGFFYLCVCSLSVWGTRQDCLCLHLFLSLSMRLKYVSPASRSQVRKNLGKTSLSFSWCCLTCVYTKRECPGVQKKMTILLPALTLTHVALVAFD